MRTIPWPFRLGPIVRISLGLMALLIGLVLVADIVLGVIPSRLETERGTRQRVAQNLAIQLTALLQAGEDALAGQTLLQVLEHDGGILAVTVRRNDGSVVLQRGAAVAAGQGDVGQASSIDRLRVPVLSGRQTWGEVEVRFTAAQPATLRAWLALPALQMLLVFSVGGFALSYAYLRRAMQYLDPSAAVPDRVRKAFDTLTEGVVILDQQARIVLANGAFRALHASAHGEVMGRKMESFAWLRREQGASATTPLPWTRTLEDGVAVEAAPFTVEHDDGPAIRLHVTSAPIADAKGRARGCIVTLDDITPVHRANDALRETLADLQRSRERVEAQNRELLVLATRDSLTGCLNRRAFFQAAESAFDEATKLQGEFCCVMVDIDHFKQFNDLYGHSVGDQVIQVVARALSAGMREMDLLCRYGGEEFCVALPGASLDVALGVAERWRLAIQDHAHEAIRGTAVMPITASFGVSTRAVGARSLQETIEHADQALYRSKAAGRNRASAFER